MTQLESPPAEQRATPRIGVHRAVPASIYHAWDCCSASRLNKLSRSPLHLRHSIDHPEQTPDQLLGEALHLAVLQPELFDFEVADRCSAATSRGKQCSKGGKVMREGRWYCSQHDPDAGAPMPDLRVLSADDAAAVNAWAAAIREHPAASLALRGAGEMELSLVWKEEMAEGLLCKARLDRLDPLTEVIWDLKTTTDASPDGFGRSIFTWGYHRQAAMYLRAAAALNLPAHSFGFIAVEKEPPYAVGAYVLDSEAVKLGEQQLGALMGEYRRCCIEQDWPGYGDDVRVIYLPAWAMKELVI